MDSTLEPMWFISVFILSELLPGGYVVKNQPTNAGDLGLIPRSRRSPGKGNGNPLHYSCLGNPMDRGAWQAMVHGVAKGFWKELVTKQQSQLVWKWKEIQEWKQNPFVLSCYKYFSLEGMEKRKSQNWDVSCEVKYS